MKTKTKIIVGSLLLVFLLILLAVAALVGGFAYLYQKAGDPVIKAKVDKAKADGTQFGKSTDQNGCMEKGFTLVPPTESFDVSNEYFVKACLHASRPTANFCDGVPLMLDRKWFDDQCEKAGRDNQQCTVTFLAKRDFCRLDSKDE